MPLDPLEHLEGEVQRFEHDEDPGALLGVDPFAIDDELGKRLLPGVPERRVPDVVAEAQRLGQRLVERQVAGDGAADLGDVEGVGEPGDVVVALGVHEDLGLVLQPAERLRVEDAVTVALERGAVAVGELGHRPALRLRRPRRPGGEQLVLEPFRVLSGAAEERSGHSSPSSGQPLGRHASVVFDCCIITGAGSPGPPQATWERPSRCPVSWLIR